MHNLSRLVVISISLVCTPVLAETVVPHTFSSGEAAVADEVNENFTALASAIDDAVTRIDNAAASIATLEEDVLTLNSLATRLTTLEGEVLTLSGLAARIDTLEEKAVTLDSLTARIDTLEEEVPAVESLVTRVDSLEAEGLTAGALAARVDKLEGVGLTVEDVAGDYVFTGLQIGLMRADNDTTSIIETAAYSGTFKFLSDGTFTLNTSEENSSIQINDDDGERTPESVSSSETVTGTWTLSGTSVTVLLGDGDTINFTGVSGNNLLVGLEASYEASNRAYGKFLIILTKSD